MIDAIDRRVVRIWCALVCALAPVITGCAREDYAITDVHYLKGERLSDDAVTVTLRGDKISYIGTHPPRAKHSVAGTGLVLAPGFLDANSCGWLDQKASDLKLADGITTYLNAHGDRLRATIDAEGVPARLNYATSVGVLTLAGRPLFEILSLLEDSLRFGAYTISLSPEYSHFTTPELVRQICTHFASKRALISFHTRFSDEEHELAGLAEALECAEQGNPVHILHLNSTGATYHPRAAMQLVAEARQKGADVSLDFYPYRWWASSIARARFDGDWKKRYRVGIEKLAIPGDPTPLTEARLDEMREHNANVTVMVDSIPPTTVDYFALETDAPIGTDTSATKANEHPRGAGSFTKFIGDYVDSGKITFDQALYRLSTLAHRQFERFIPELKRRGAIAVGNYADLILWDRAKIKSTSTILDPLSRSTGVVAAFVNGTPLILDGQPANQSAHPGRHLKGTWSGR